MRILIINGPNLNLLGHREPQWYGNVSFETFLEELRQRFPQVQIEYFQSNSEGALIDSLHQLGQQADGIVINAGAYAHTSIALADALAAVGRPTIEVHISNVFARETYRHHSYLTARCIGCIIGLGLEGYALAIEYLLRQQNS
ncbi:MAG: type II 3-dehydroquinate dehydratase [Saprospiraceae bacterium]|nr:type II 3-dehydroquinate dehydratase [Saprospiraceae bacterium]MDW8229887.1 type II 3-dehydroquinate dehydratase [Saprospiraceae bacterium]